MHFSQSYRVAHRFLFLFLLLPLFWASCGTNRKLAVKDNGVSLQEEVVGYGKKFLHTAYRSGGKSPGGFDCSGFTSFVFQKFGYRLDKSSSGQASQVWSIDSPQDLKTGDLVFYEGRRQNGAVGHVGIVTEVKSNGQFRFIHSSTSNGVIISSSEEPYYKIRYVKGGRVIDDGGRLYAAAAQKTKKRQPPAVRGKAGGSDAQAVSANAGATIAIVAVNAGAPQLPAEEYASCPAVITSESAAPVAKSAGRPDDDRKKQQDKIKNAVKTAMIQQEPETVPEPEVSILAENDAGTILYTVGAGDTLYAISRKHGCSVENLRSWNPELKNTLRPGQTIAIRK